MKTAREYEKKVSFRKFRSEEEPANLESSEPKIKGQKKRIETMREYTTKAESE